MESTLSSAAPAQSRKPRLFEALTLDQCIERSRNEQSSKKKTSGVSAKSKGDNKPKPRQKAKPKVSSRRNQKPDALAESSAARTKADGGRQSNSRAETLEPAKNADSERRTQRPAADLKPAAGIKKPQKNKRKGRVPAETSRGTGPGNTSEKSPPSSSSGRQRSPPVVHNERDTPRNADFAPTSKSRHSTTAHRISVSNLNEKVSDEDVMELFSAVGPLISARLLRDADGRSVGRADVVFAEMSDALEAIKRYNGVPLDSMPLKITLASERSRALEEQAANDAKSSRGRQGAHARISKRPFRGPPGRRNGDGVAHGRRSAY